MIITYADSSYFKGERIAVSGDPVTRKVFFLINIYTLFYGTRGHFFFFFNLKKIVFSLQHWESG